MYKLLLTTQQGQSDEIYKMERSPSGHRLRSLGQPFFVAFTSVGEILFTWKVPEQTTQPQE